MPDWPPNTPDDAPKSETTIWYDGGEEIYKDLVESSPDLIWQCDNTGRYTFLSPACETIFGYTRAEMLGKPFTVFMTAERAAKDMETFGMVLSQGSVRNYETVYIHKDGTDVHLSFSASYIRGADGTILGTRGVARDITERVRTERELSESRQRHREMVMQSPMGMHFYELINDQLVFSDYNPAADRLLGTSNAEFVGKTIGEAFPPLLQTEIPARYREAAQNGIPFFTEQIAYADDKIAGAFEVHAFQIAPMKMVAVFLDITERKRAEEALKIEKERVSVTLASIGDGVIATDVHGKVTLMNKVAELLTGWSAAECHQRLLKDMFHIINELTGEPVENPVDKVLRTRAIVDMANHTVLISKDGTQRQIADSGAPIFNGEGHIIGVVLVFRDVTEKTRMDQAVQRTQKLESLGILAGGIAHDFNNLLGGIFGYLDVAAAMTDNPEIKRYIDKAFFTMNRAKGLTEQLLTFAKGGHPILSTVAPAPVIERAARFILSGKNVSLVCEFATDLRFFRVDENQFGQVIDNIVLNAQQAMPNGGTITIAAQNETLLPNQHPSLPAGEYIRIEISDTGAGIPKEAINRIFDPFFTTKQQGSGLGLATCYSIVTRHDGAIDVLSEPNQGTCFIIRIPATDQLDKNSIHPAQTTRTHTGRILIMDDEEYIREVLGMMLDVLGYEVVATVTGEQAVEKISEQANNGSFDAVILDLTIPGHMGGKEAASLIRQMAPSVHIFLSSGYSDDPVIAEPEKYGFSGSFIKPYRIEDVKQILDRYL